jgi:hypothetical protein
MIVYVSRKKILSVLLAVLVAAAIVCAGSTPSYAASKANVKFIVQYPACPSVIFSLKSENETYERPTWGGPYYIDGKEVSYKTINKLWDNGDIYNKDYQKKHTVGNSVTFKNVAKGEYSLVADGFTIKTIKKNIKVNTTKAKTIKLKIKKW